jgi:hypothetical protein
MRLLICNFSLIFLEKYTICFERKIFINDRDEDYFLVHENFKFTNYLFININIFRQIEINLFIYLFT